MADNNEKCSAHPEVDSSLDVKETANQQLQAQVEQWKLEKQKLEQEKSQLQAELKSKAVLLKKQETENQKLQGRIVWLRFKNQELEQEKSKLEEELRSKASLLEEKETANQVEQSKLKNQKLENRIQLYVAATPWYNGTEQLKVPILYEAEQKKLIVPIASFCTKLSGSLKDINDNIEELITKDPSLTLLQIAVIVCKTLGIYGPDPTLKKLLSSIANASGARGKPHHCRNAMSNLLNVCNILRVENDYLGWRETFPVAMKAVWNLPVSNISSLFEKYKSLVEEECQESMDNIIRHFKRMTAKETISRVLKQGEKYRTVSIVMAYIYCLLAQTVEAVLRFVMN